MKSGYSVVIPAYNAEQWLESTVRKTVDALEEARIINYEIIIVDDGSHDATNHVAVSLKSKFDHVALISQKNSGRFIARKRGVDSAQYDRILFVDTRTWIDKNALKFINDQIKTHPERKIWNAHINVAKKGNIIARFGDAITCIGWRRYFKNPRLMSYGLSDFDYYPKGTGLFNVPTEIIKEAINWFETITTDIKNSSDDTLLIRHIAEQNKIWLSPQYNGTYFSRTTLLAFIKHTYYRGQFFVDGFLRKGTRFYYPLICFLIVSVLSVVGLILFPHLILAVIYIALGVWLVELLVAITLGINLQDALALFVLTPLFTVMYGLGIWRAVIRRIF